MPIEIRNLPNYSPNNRVLGIVNDTIGLVDYPPTVTPPPPQPVEFETESPLPNGTEGISYFYEIKALGQAPYTFTHVGGTLPIGITLSSSGVLSGVSTAAVYSFDIRVQDSNGSMAINTFSLTIISFPIIDQTDASNWALQFDVAKYNHVNTGLIWKHNVSYGNFYSGFWIKPLGDGYVFSAGYGGAHILLFGLSGSPSLGYTLTGNVFNALTNTPTSFTSSSKIRHNEWAYVAVCGFGGNKIVTIINGIPSRIVPWDGVRRTNAPYESVGYIGGSDHQNFTGLIAGWHHYEGSIPYITPQNFVVRPPLDTFNIGMVYDGTNYQSANLILDFRNKSLADIGTGIEGTRHHGFLAETLSTGTAGNSESFNFSVGNRNASANLPKWVVDPIIFTGSSAPKTPISGSRIYDSFGRPDVHWGKQAVLGCGLTELGNRTWTNTSYGHSNGEMFATGTSSGFNLVPDTVADSSVTIRRDSTYFPLGEGVGYSLIIRYTDDYNYIRLLADEYGQAYVLSYVAGAQTLICNASIGITWSELKITATGSLFEISVNGTVAAIGTTTQNPTTTHKGVILSQLVKISEFAVI